MSNIIEARVEQKKDTLPNWEANPMILLDGEQAFVVGSTGQPINFKIGDGTKRFSELPFWIQYDQAAFVSVSGFALPTPTQPVGYSILGEGTYTHSGGGFTVPAGHWGVANWDGSAWSFSDMGAFPIQEGTDTLEPELIPKGKAVEAYAEPRTSLKILPEGYEYLENDRPDMQTEDIIIVDENGYFIPKPEYLPKDSSRILPEGYEYMENDRPDLDFSLIITDANGYYIPDNGDSVNSIEELKKLITYSYFGEVDGYPVESVKDLNAYYSQWDDIMANDSSYITKSTLSPSGLLSLPIYRYDFKPSAPKLKVMIAGCTHGWEKNFSFGLRVFMKQLTENWKGNEALTFLRQNVHFIVVPVVSPDPFVTNPFNGSVRIRDRAGYETPPFNASWTKSGNVVTITFNSADFPANSRVSASNYFTARPAGEIVNKVGVTLFESSNLTELPDDVYDIKSVIDARTITINTPTSGSGSGTIKMCVKSDVNRNAGTASWGSLGHSPTSKIGYPVGYYDNKGTKPFSLAETTNVKNILDANKDIAFYYDFHSGAGDYVTYISYPSSNKDDSFNVLSNVYKNLFGFTPEYRIGDDYSALFVYAKESNGIVGSNPEWHATEVETGVMDSQQATDMHNWIGNLLTISSKINLLIK